VPEFWLSIVAGLQVPFIPLDEDIGKTGTGCPAQIVRLDPKANVGGMFGLTTTLNVVGFAHCPALGVNV
jgi:hypothetical protein